MASAKSFMLYFDNKEQFEMMTDAQAGALIKALFAFAETGEAPEISDGMVKMAFSFISAQISRDTEKYENICKKRAESIKKRWNKSNSEDTKNTNEYKCTICNTNDSYTDTDTDTETETETDTETDTDTDTDTETETTPETDKPSCASPSQSDVEKIIEMYHSICKSFPRIKAMSNTRRKTIKARLRVYGSDAFETVFSKVEKSDFLKGSNNHSWSATFDWIIKESNFVKILDGNYDNKPNARGQPPHDDFDVEKYKQFINNF